MSIRYCSACDGSGWLCRRKGCTKRRDHGTPHRDHPNAGMRRCPTHHDRVVTCDRCLRTVDEASDADGWEYVLGKVACLQCSAVFERMEPAIMGVAWDAFCEGSLGMPAALLPSHDSSGGGGVVGKGRG